MKRILAVVAILFVTTNFAIADFNSGLKAYNAGNYKAAQADWLAAGLAGDVNAQLNLGVLYENGTSDVKKDVVKALAWYRLAAAQNVAAGQEAVIRLKSSMNTEQVNRAEDRAVKILGKWFRTNIGRDEAEYLAARKKREQRKKEKLAREKAASKTQANRQKNLVAQRDADARKANQLEKESKAAAIKAAQEHAELAKRQALMQLRREEESARQASVKNAQNSGDKAVAARRRLAELKRKSQTGSVSDATINSQISAVQKQPPEANVQSKKAVVTAAPATEIKTAKSVTAATSSATASSRIVIKKIEPQKPESGNTIVDMIFEDAKSVDLESAAAKTEIKSGRANIQALKWTLISAARGDVTSVQMVNIFKQEMTTAQIAESSRLAAIWISKR